MSVSMTKADGVTVFTLTSDHRSRCPPLCGILKGLCYSPFCCSVSRQLRGVQGNSQSVLGALHIMVGLLNIGLGAILCSSSFGSGYQMEWSLFPYWFGGIFIFFGVVCILSEKFPSRCLVLLNVILGVAGVAFAIAAIVLYSINIDEIYIYWRCSGNSRYSSSYIRPSTSPLSNFIMEKCAEGKELVLMLLKSINGVLIVLSVLELCVVISSGVLGIKALTSSTTIDPEHEEPLLEEVSSNAAV